MTISRLLLLCALSLSGVAAYYSIVGLAAIFAAAFWPVVIMASILELSKLVVASWLYQKWKTVPTFLKVYLTSAVFILMFITSLGIFGFLSKAHVEQGLGNREAVLKLEQLEQQIAQIQSTKTRDEAQLQQLDKSINIQLDANRATQALAARKQQETERNAIKTKIDAEERQILELNSQKTQLRQQITQLETKVGPIRYVAEFFSQDKSVDLDKTVQYMIVILVLVFDPLAVLMLIAANMSYARAVTKSLESTETPTDVKTVPTGPQIGQTMFDQGSKRMLWFDGAAWQSFQSEQPSVAPAQAIDLEEIKSVVKNAMDSWLTTADTAANTVKEQQVTDSPEVADIVHDALPPSDDSIILPSASPASPASTPDGRKWL